MLRLLYALILLTYLSRLPVQAITTLNAEILVFQVVGMVSLAQEMGSKPLQLSGIGRSPFSALKSTSW